MKPFAQGLGNVKLRQIVRKRIRKYQPKATIRVMGAHEHRPRVHNLPACLIFNTEPIHKTGEHWIGIYITKKRRGYFFDSFGRSPHQLNKKCWVKMLNDNTHTWSWNKRQVQDLDSSLCGYFVCKAMEELAKGHSFDQVLKGLNEQSVREYISKVE